MVWSWPSTRLLRFCLIRSTPNPESNRTCPAQPGRTCKTPTLKTTYQDTNPSLLPPTSTPCTGWAGLPNKRVGDSDPVPCTLLGLSHFYNGPRYGWVRRVGFVRARFGLGSGSVRPVVTSRNRTHPDQYGVYHLFNMLVLSSQLDFRLTKMFRFPS